MRGETAHEWGTRDMDRPSAYLASGMSHAEILRDFPYLTDDDIRACLAFAADRERKLETLVA
jgi:hypothetical protein